MKTTSAEFSEHRQEREDSESERRFKFARIWLGVLSVIALMLAFTQALQWYGGGSETSAACDPDGTECYDSGYLPVSNKASTTFFFKHRLGQTPRTMDVWFSPTQDGQRSFLLNWRFQRAEAGNPITIEARADAVYVSVWSGVPIFGYYDPPTDKWYTFTTGFYRVVARK